jgi:cephalosporin hydroxylase
LHPRPFSSDVPRSLLNSLQTGSLRYTYKGIPTQKNPFDLALYTRLLWDIKPRTLIEIGSYKGGSAIWFADQMRSMGIAGRIFSLDIIAVQNISDPIVSFITSDSLPSAMPPDWLKSLPRPMMVVEDSSHTFEHTLLVLRYFADIMQPQEYLIVEDAIVTPMGIDFDYDLNGGPAPAIQQFLSERPDFAIDAELCDFFGFNVTWNINGYLKKVGSKRRAWWRPKRR